MIKLLLMLTLIAGCGTDADEAKESWEETTEKYKDFTLKVQVRPADSYGYYMVHVISSNDELPYGEGINKNKNQAIAWALRDLAESIEDKYKD